MSRKNPVILQSELLFDEISDAYVTTQILFQNIYGSVKQRLRFIKFIIQSSFKLVLFADNKVLD